VRMSTKVDTVTVLLEVLTNTSVRKQIVAEQHLSY
jgi:hypothetical protein